MTYLERAKELLGAAEELSEHPAFPSLTERATLCVLISIAEDLQKIRIHIENEIDDHRRHR
jgi:hypothetical protein